MYIQLPFHCCGSLFSGADFRLHLLVQPHPFHQKHQLICPDFTILLCIAAFLFVLFVENSSLDQPKTTFFTAFLHLIAQHIAPYRYPMPLTFLILFTILLDPVFISDQRNKTEWYTSAADLDLCFLT